MLHDCTKSFHYYSDDPQYFFTGYIIKPIGTNVTVVHVAIVHTKSRLAHGVQSAVVQGVDGEVFGTMKHDDVSIEVAKEFWQVFRGILKRHTMAKKLHGEVPRYLADHHVETYEGIKLSKEKPCTPLPGISVVEIDLKGV